MKNRIKTKPSDLVVNFIVNKSKYIEIFFAVMVVISIFLYLFVKVNYDLTKYLPNTAASKVGLNLMEKEFGYPGTARIMIKNVSLYQAKLYKEEIEAVDGVDTVFWADTAENIEKYTDVYTSDTFIKAENIQDYYKDNCAVMDISFVKGDSDQRTSKALDKIYEIVGDKGSFTGPAVQNKSLNESLNKEMKSATVIVIAVVALVLILTTTAWLEPLLFLLVMGIAIVINMGTNVFLGEISFMTASVAPVLQMAVAMDYSIFLMHAFTEEKDAGKEPKEAIEIAIRQSASSIIACGMATIIGFLALTLMKFSIGYDLGIVLAKGIFISLLTVLFLMPSLIIRSQNMIQKTAHRKLVKLPKRLGKGILKIKYVALGLAIFLAVPCFIAKDMNSFLFGNSAVGAGEGTQVYKDEQEIDRIFGRSNMLMALIPDDSNIKEKELSDELGKLSYVKKITSLENTLPEGIPESIIPNRITTQLHSGKYARILIYIRTREESDAAFRYADGIKAIVQKYYPQHSSLIGATTFTQDIKTILTRDYTFVDKLSLIGVVIVAVIVFKSLLIPILLVVPIEIAIFFNMAVPYFMGENMIFMGYIIVSCIQLAATVDYSILMTNYYLEYRMHLDKREAILETIWAAVPPIMNSGLILSFAGYTLYFTSSIAAIGAMGHLIGRGALMSIAMVVLLLPALLYIFDGRIYKHISRMNQLKDKARKKLADKLQLGEVLPKTIEDKSSESLEGLKNEN
ncbi:efflux RND transporter permease subunit [Clostridium sp. HV4-5-A1G]|jgi:predicted RND superfamily exporter protein|uniref:efflux RND transporter permease subunit n=1 Tax=Clostridium sp. HV4-5-A1G TaxID=2004595 RepID=UPI001238C646|nr:MMPL family transporter [Clostridium sp. HV4-5-A1G]KAA8668508.1 MMPL family transporter [Clostridium sp. HV4-5-A1G]